MHSKNKRAMTAFERRHVEAVKELPCGVCDTQNISECHEIEQGLWFTSIPLCPDCHRGAHNGVHGQRRIWSVKKISEMSCLNETIKKLLDSRHG